MIWSQTGVWLHPCSLLEGCEVSRSWKWLPCLGPWIWYGLSGFLFLYIAYHWCVFITTGQSKPEMTAILVGSSLVPSFIYLVSSPFCEVDFVVSHLLLPNPSTLLLFSPWTHGTLYLCLYLDILILPTRTYIPEGQNFVLFPPRFLWS